MSIKYFTLFLTVFIIGYIAACYYISNSNASAFDSIKIGDTIDTVIKKFGTPRFREKRGVLYSRYATSPCAHPCFERIWFENRLLLIVDEAWSLEINEEGEVIKKSYWVST